MIFSLKGARNIAGFTQKEVAKQLGISKSTIAKLEKDSTNIKKDLLDRFTELYKIDQDNVYLGRYDEYIKIYRSERFKQKIH